MGFDGNNATSKVTALHNGNGYVKKPKRKVNLDLEAMAAGYASMGNYNQEYANSVIVSENDSENTTIELVTRGE